jgi:hypothetical protein
MTRIKRIDNVLTGQGVEKEPGPMTTMEVESRRRAYLPTAEADRRDRIAESIAHALMLADAMQRVALDEYDRMPPDSPLCNAMSESQAGIENTVAELHVACRQIENGRYEFVDPQRNAGVAMMNGLNALITGEK